MLSTTFFGDSVFDDFPEYRISSRPALKGLEMDMRETDTSFETLVNVPGVEKEDIDISIEEDVLTVSVEQHNNKSKDGEQDGVKYHWKERGFSKVSRSIKLPGHVDRAGIKATTKDGVLEIHLPKHKEDPRTVKKISIN